MEGNNYWAKPWRSFYQEMTLVAAATQTDYPIVGLPTDFTDNCEIIGIRVREPHASGYTKAGKKILTASILMAAHLVIVDDSEKPVVTTPLYSAVNRTGGDNNFLRLSPGIKYDFNSGRSLIKLTCPAGTITTAVTNTEAIELEFLCVDKNACNNCPI